MRGRSNDRIANSMSERILTNDAMPDDIRRGFTEDLRGLPARARRARLAVERRREAFARFQAFAWPSARDEEWRRTDIRGLRLDAFASTGQ